jgi:hypothetical protein
MHAIVVRSTLHDFQQGRNFLRQQGVLRAKTGSGLRGWALGPAGAEQRHCNAHLRIRGSSEGGGGATRKEPATG